MEDLIGVVGRDRSRQCRVEFEEFRRVLVGVRIPAGPDDPADILDVALGDIDSFPDQVGHVLDVEL